MHFVVVRYVFEGYSFSFSHVIHELRNDAPAVMLVCVHVLQPLSAQGVLSNTSISHSCCRVLLLLLLLFRALVIRMCPVRCTSTCLVSKSCLIDALLEGWRTVSRVPLRSQPHLGRRSCASHWVTCPNRLQVGRNARPVMRRLAVQSSRLSSTSCSALVRRPCG